MLETYIGERPDGLQINHIDGNKQNNSVDNLEYVTQSENLKHAFRIGLRSLKRENHNRAKLDELAVICIKDCINKGVSNKSIASLFGVDASLISHIKRGTKWA